MKTQASIFLLVGAALHTHVASAQSKEKPNILWFVSEDNSPLINAYGDSTIQTPHLNKLAQEGIIFDHAFANAPVCAASRSTIITGMYPTSLGSEHMRCHVAVNDEVRFFPNYLKEAGYFTSLRLKRDYNIPKQEGTWDEDAWWNVEDALKERKDGQPFFMFYNTWISHEGKVHAKTPKYDYFRSSTEYLEKQYVDSLLASIDTVRPNEVSVPSYLPDIPEVRHDIAKYYDILKLLDLEFGLVMNELEKRGLLENTIVIYSSDHGGVLGRSKRFTFESGLHVPFIVKVPQKLAKKYPKKGRNDEVISFIDMAPTILAMAGIDKPAQMVGKDIFAKGEEKYAYGFRGRMDETYDMVRTIRGKQYRYIRNFYLHKPAGSDILFLNSATNTQATAQAFKDGKLTPIQSIHFTAKPVEELYLIAEDKDNVQNLVGDMAHDAVLTEMRQALYQKTLAIKDIGFIPEGELYAQSTKQGITYQAYAHTLPLEQIISTAYQLTATPNIVATHHALSSDVSTIQFWGAIACLAYPQQHQVLKPALISFLKEAKGDVKATLAEALYVMGEKEIALQAFEKLLQEENDFVKLRVLNAMETQNVPVKRFENVLQTLQAYQQKELGKDYLKRKAGFLLTKASLD